MLLTKTNLLLSGFFFISLISYSQIDILDYVVKDSDTLYGTIRANGTQNRLWFYQRVNKPNGKSYIQESRISKKKIKTLRRNGKIYRYLDGDYQATEPIITNYIITTKGDTITGEVKTSRLFRKKQLVDTNGIEHPITTDVVYEYSENNRIYRFINGSFSRLILEGPVSLYYFYQTGVNSGGGFGMDFQADLSGVYIQKGEEFQRIYNSGFLLVTRELFGDNLDLLERIEQREFAIENIYLVTQIYNRYIENTNISL